jgi:5-methylcytosine-specific restriction endonuclease McrA
VQHLRDTNTSTGYVNYLRALHRDRDLRKNDGQSRLRGRLSQSKRRAVFEKTGGRCHLCGGLVADGDKWQADHVAAHVTGGPHALENFLTAHAACNNYKWHYLPEEIQEILRLGVWIRTEMEKCTPLGRVATERFVKCDQIRQNR